MDMKEAGSISRPPLLVGTNYGYWKARMKIFISALDDLAWYFVENEWKPPMTTTKEGESSSKSVVKPRSEWSATERMEMQANNKALNAICTAVDANQFRSIASCTLAKKAWDTLEIVHEGTSKVRESKLQQLTTQFEQLKMEEDETVADFVGRLRDITNKAGQLGKTYKEYKLVRKTMRSLTKPFIVKISAVEELDDLSTMTLDELVGILQTFEMTLEHHPKKGKKDLAFKAKVSRPTSEDESEDDDQAYISRNYAKALRRTRRNDRENSSSNQRNNFEAGGNRSRKTEQSNHQLSRNQNFESKQEDQIICRECGGVGHIRSECPTAQKRLGKSFVATWDDDDEYTNNFVSFGAKVIENEALSVEQVNSDPCFNMDVKTKGTHVDFDFSSSSYSSSDSECRSSNVEDIGNAYDEMYDTWLKEVETNKGLRMEKEVLVNQVEQLNIEVVILKSNMACVTKRLEAAESTMNEVNSRQGLGYVEEVQKQERRKSGDVDVKTSTTNVSSYVSTCVLLLFCWWFASSICVTVQSGDTWHSDSACSRHLTRTPEVLDNGIPRSGYATFEDGPRSRVIGKGELDIKEFPKFLDAKRITVDEMEGFEKSVPDHVKTSLPVTELVSSDVETSNVFGATSEGESEIDTSTIPLQQRTQAIGCYRFLAGFESQNEVLDGHVKTSRQFAENTKSLDSATFECLRQHLGVCRD